MMLPASSDAIVERQPFPRPRVTIRELVGLIAAIALSNGLLSWWIRPAPLNQHPVGRDLSYAFWNGMLFFYLGFAHLQSWIRRVLQWLDTRSSRPDSRRPPRFSALFVAEATVIGGTTAIWPVLLLDRFLSQGLTIEDCLEAAIPLAIVGASLVLYMFRRNQSSPRVFRKTGSGSRQS